MKKFFLTLIAAVALFCVQAQSRLVDTAIESEILGTTKQYTVYLPDGYDDSGADYPVLYLLHGAWGNFRDWPEKGNLRTIADETIASGAALPMVIVMPDASGEGDNFAGAHMGYFNREGWMYEDFFFQEFVPAVEKEYRIKPERGQRAIAGLSMGGGGTAVYALYHPDMFSSAYIMSGLLGYSPSLDSGSLEKDFVDSAWVNQPVAIALGLSREQIQEADRVRWFVDCGDDDYLLDGNIDFFTVMRKHRIPIELRIRNGSHSWEYWRTSLPTALTFVSTGFCKKKTPPIYVERTF